MNIDSVALLHSSSAHANNATMWLLFVTTLYEEGEMYLALSQLYRKY